MRISVPHFVQRTVSVVSPAEMRKTVPQPGHRVLTFSDMAA